MADEQPWPTPRYAEEIVFDGRARLAIAPEEYEALYNAHAALRAQFEQAQDKFTKTILAAKGQAVELGELRATIARQREWIEKAGHRRKCSVRAPHAATMDYKPTCDCGYSELTEN